MLHVNWQPIDFNLNTHNLVTKHYFSLNMANFKKYVFLFYFILFSTHV